MRPSADWEKMVTAIPCTKQNTDQWVLDFLVTQGHEQAVIRFCEETGLSVPEAIQTLPLRNAVRQHILKGNVSQALDFLSEQKPELEMIELLRTGDVEKALAFATEVLAPLGEENPDLLSELEQTMSLFIVLDLSTSDMSALPAYAKTLWDLQYRDVVASQVNASWLEMERQPSQPTLPLLVDMMTYGEQLLGPDGPGQQYVPTLSLDGSIPAIPDRHHDL
ncbi:and domain-containing protein [Malassezia pachydermatis]|uniref:And domain-containing protein n=1 Tax=Malassezia pachydermatis TaxID=77020 RepID=A0A0M9VQY8_9BASI|nr:and domain-containing protein [Malassezia pachydermatis]KOS16039.1 and domain-containing protein [Malassezia pachydermatis]